MFGFFKKKQAAPARTSLHPSLDNGLKKGSDSFSGGTLV